MSYHKHIPQENIKELEEIISKTKDARILKRAQTIYYRIKNGLLPDKIAKMTGYSIGTVRNLHNQYMREGNKIFDIGNQGGKRPKYITHEEEQDLLASFIEKSDKGGILEVKKIHEAHCEKVGKKLALQTTYKMLKRHNWRKISPRTLHPKANIEAQEDFKKNGPILFKK